MEVGKKKRLQTPPVSILQTKKREKDKKVYRRGPRASPRREEGDNPLTCYSQQKGGGGRDSNRHLQGDRNQQAKKENGLRNQGSITTKKGN